MSGSGPALRVLIKQARLNSQLISAITILARATDLGEHAERLIEVLNAAVDKNNELVDALDEAIEKFGD